jgi:hypothetical protein
MATLLLADLSYRALDLEAHYTDFGVLPIEVARSLTEGAWSLHWMDGSLAFQAALFVAAAALAFALGVGWHTRLATFGSWVLLASLHSRNPLVLVGGDFVLRLLLFWSLFLPLGARWSLDARTRCAPAPDRVFSVAGAGLLLQVACIYPIAAVFKRQEPVWQELRFLEQSMRVDGVATAFGQRLLDVPELLQGLSWLALQLETWGVLLAFSPLATGPLRLAAVALFAAFHLVGIGTTFDLGLFEYAMALAWVAFVPTWFWAKITNVPVRRRKLGDAEHAGMPLNFLAGCFLICIAIHNAGTLRGNLWRESTGRCGWIRPGRSGAAYRPTATTSSRRG